ncbi:6,7-dimethyl-8-ribityllumazine synthase [Acidimicrobiia bacterium]|nr:6,7-dimethyl-8-ribityllumazine synthase [Acidimicrobiia bacterium]
MKNKVAIISADYYGEYTEQLITGATSILDGNFEYDIFRVKGAWDIVFKANSLTSTYDKFIVIGIICKGDTDHYEYISSSVATALMNLTIHKEVYIANCILNVHNLEQAAKRCKDDNNKGKEAALALKDIFS